MCMWKLIPMIDEIIEIFFHADEFCKIMYGHQVPEEIAKKKK